jgi:hypothetical protein
VRVTHVVYSTGRALPVPIPDPPRAHPIPIITDHRRDIYANPTYPIIYHIHMYVAVSGAYLLSPARHDPSAACVCALLYVHHACRPRSLLVPIRVAGQHKIWKLTQQAGAMALMGLGAAKALQHKSAQAR